MSEILWTGESVFCQCGHHVKDHVSTCDIMDLHSNERYFHCKIGCSCREFLVYRVLEARLID